MPLKNQPARQCLARRFIALSPRRLQTIGKPIDCVGFHRVCDDRDRIDDATLVAFKYPRIESGSTRFDLQQHHSGVALLAPGTFDRRQGRAWIAAARHHGWSRTDNNPV
jgi:hypothetical protein